MRNRFYQTRLSLDSTDSTAASLASQPGVMSTLFERTVLSQRDLLNTFHWAESFGILVHRQSIKSGQEGRTNEGCGRGTRIFARATAATVP